ncbi:MAG: hypothetical protein Q9169_007776 [Polycauliona sp. 2 TL-2023]
MGETGGDRDNGSRPREFKSFSEQRSSLFRGEHIWDQTTGPPDIIEEIFPEAGAVAHGIILNLLPQSSLTSSSENRLYNACAEKRHIPAREGRQIAEGFRCGFTEASAQLDFAVLKATSTNGISTLTKFREESQTEKRANEKSDFLRIDCMDGGGWCSSFRAPGASPQTGWRPHPLRQRWRAEWPWK